MIYTVTLNPAIDYMAVVTDFKPGELNYADYGNMTFGGKGLNVSAVLSSFEVENIALGFCGGWTGDAIIKMAQEAGVKCDFIRLEGQNSRINVKIKSGAETELNGKGPTVSGVALNALYEKLSELKEGDILVLSGSVPKGLSPTIYMDLMSRLPKGVKTVVDASGQALKNALSMKPYLIKPNAQELGDMYGVKIEVKTDAIFYGRKLVDAGAENVLVSLGGGGAVLVTRDEAYEMNAPEGEVINSVGAGDSMVAGFLTAIVSGEGLLDALRLGICAGSATAFSETLATKDEILRLLSAELR
ncbi:MAG: 1-phosphofructokinase [Clostridia bacterium]|nr:1-phosphofructokinase [Clostridia bacterium]